LFVNFGLPLFGMPFAAGGGVFGLVLVLGDASVVSQ